MKPKLPDHIVEQIKRVNLVQLIGADKLHKKTPTEYDGPCPKCQGVDRFTVRADGWFCRHCKPLDPKHGWHDALDYLVWARGLSIRAAVEELTGEKLKDETKMVAMEVAAPKEKPRAADWQAKAQVQVDKAHGDLMDGDGPGADYLAARGLDAGTWQAFHVGFRLHLDKDLGVERPAIVLPWYGKDGLMAVRCRFIDDAGKRLVAFKDSIFRGVLFGRRALFGCAEKYRTLMLCEGELNALSIWQTQHEGALDVLSVGSESAKLTDSMVAYAQRFARVIVWMDKPENARALMSAIPGACGISSPNGKDANDLMREGLLGGFLTAARFKAAQNEHERQKLYWDIWDMLRVSGFYDEGTVKALEKVKVAA